MRCLMVVLGITVFGAFVHAADTFEGRLLSYNQLMALTPAKQMEYLKDLRELLVLMEQHDDKYAVASSMQTHDLREEIAMILQMFSVLPEAAAGVDEDAEPAPPEARPGPGRTPPQVKPPPVAKTPPEAKGDAAAVAPPPAGGASCPTPNFNCEALDPDAKARLEQKFRGDHSAGANICISGGFFSRYKSDKKLKGQCEIVREFPPGNKICQAQGPNRALCNPWVFCLSPRSPDPKAPNDRSKDQVNPVTQCEKYGGAAGFNITERCNKWYDDHKDGQPIKILKSGKDGKKETLELHAKPCNPATANMAGMKDEWAKLTEQMTKKYQRWCLQDEGFQALFCSECKVMGEHIHAMNTRATGSGCTPAAGSKAGALPPAPDAPAAPERNHTNDSRPDGF